MTANLSRILRWNRHRHEDVTALVFEERRWTYAELDDEVDAVAAGLRHLGIDRGEVVALLSLNSPEYLITSLALARIGAVFLPLNYRLHAEELAYVLGHSGATTILTEQDFHEVVAAILPRLGDLGRVITTSEPAPDGWLTYGELRALGEGATVADAEVGPDDLQRIMYTSGTTSAPKGAMLTHGNCNANLDMQVVELALAPGQSILVFGPLYHVGGLDIPGFAVWYAGATMVLMRRFDAPSILRLVDDHQIVGMTMVATMVHMIRELPDRLSFDTSSVRWLIFSQVAERLFHDTMEVFPAARLIEGYGLTETCNGIAYLDGANMFRKLGSVGRPTHRVDVRIVDDDDQPVATGDLGEIVVRGPKVSPGYWRDPELTASTHRGGWFHTGDIGRFDDDGYLYVVDRKKDMIRSGGENLASSEVERVLYDHPDVSEAAVIGIPDERWGEVPRAHIVLRHGASTSARDLVDFCAARLAKFKVPRDVVFMSELPRNPSGKVLKRELREYEDDGTNTNRGEADGTQTA